MSKKQRVFTPKLLGYTASKIHLDTTVRRLERRGFKAFLLHQTGVCCLQDFVMRLFVLENQVMP